MPRYRSPFLRKHRRTSSSSSSSSERSRSRSPIQRVRQKERLREDQVRNNEGGLVWKVDDETKLRRFLCLGTEGGTYYTTEKKLTKDNAESVVRMIEEGKGLDVLEEITTISIEGRAVKQGPTLFALALCAKLPSMMMEEGKIGELRKKTYTALPKICRIPTYLFHFVDYCESLSGESSGWGREHRNGIAAWYLAKSPEELAFAVTKYQQRDGWSHRDLLRLAHPKPEKGQHKSEEYSDIFHYICKGYKEMVEKKRPSLSKAVTFLAAVEEAKMTEDTERLVDLILKHGLVREHIPTQMLRKPQVWRALLHKMPLTALIRNLNKLTSIGVLSNECEAVCAKLRDEELLHKAKVHPFNVLVALYAYKKGRGAKLEWEPIPAVESALDEAFQLSFKNLPPTGQRILIALDVSGSMSTCIMGSAISARVVSVAMSLITLRTEEMVDFVGFSHRIKSLPFRKSWGLEQMIEYVEKMDFGLTDCSLPMSWAAKERKSYDMLIVYTDNETYFGNIHPAVALQRYRERMRLPNARLVVVGLTATDFTIADPEDRGMLDVVGFDSAAPEIIRNFALGHI